MGQYAAMSTAFDTDPKVLRLDIFGRSTFLLIVRLAKLHGWGGKLSIDHWDPDYLATLLGAAGFESNVKAQMSKVLKTGMIEITESQIIVKNWDSHQRDPTNAERQRKHQEKKKAAKVTLDNESNTKGLEGIGIEGGAPAHDSYRMGDPAVLAVVDLITAKFTAWTDEQALNSFGVLRSGHPTIPLNAWAGIVERAHTDADPELRTDRIHQQINRIARYYELDAAKDAPPEAQPKTPLQALNAQIAGGETINTAQATKTLAAALAAGEDFGVLLETWIYNCRQAGSMGVNGYVFCENGDLLSRELEIAPWPRG